ncbi:MAG: aldo/keto reductase [Ardenticatenaceae bacterium]|nr:aldo/keto reductase [Ardenticatenaceae bacterium]
MNFKLLGRSGLRVSELCLGTMTFGDDWGWGASKDESRKVFDMFVNRGGNFIDTACNYTEGTSEKFVGEFVASDRDYFVVATKYTLMGDTWNRKDPNLGGNSRKNLRRSVEASLRRMNTDHIDLLYLHMWDFTTPVLEVMRGVDDLVRAGKVLYFGFSDTPAWIVSYAIGLAEQYGLTRPVAIQLPYSVASRDGERALIPMAKQFDLAVTSWGMLAGGVLTGKYSVDSDQPKRYNSASERGMALAKKVAEIAQEIGRSPAQVAIRWVHQQARHLIPIIGARTAAQLEDNLGVLDFELSHEDLTVLNGISEFKRGFPLDFLSDDHVRGLIFGETFAQIDNHRA